MRTSSFYLSFLWFYVSCVNDQEKVDIIARVHDSTLSRVEAGALAGVDSTNLVSIVSEWVANEILYYHALTNSFESQIRPFTDTQKRLTGQQFLRHLASADITVTDPEISLYYKENENSFKKDKSGAFIYHFIFPNPGEAEDVLHILSVAGTKEEKNKLFSDYNVRPLLIYEDEILPVLSNAVFYNTAQKLHGPLLSRFGYHVVYIKERIKKGTAPPLSELYDEIYFRIYQHKLSLKSLYLLDSLSNHTSYEIFLQ